MMTETADRSANSGLAMLMSFIWPGLGQLYQRRFTSGALFLGGSLVCTVVAFLSSRFSIAGWTAVAVLAMWSVVDVYRSKPQGSGS